MARVLFAMALSGHEAHLSQQALHRLDWLLRTKNVHVALLLITLASSSFAAPADGKHAN